MYEVQIDLEEYFKGDRYDDIIDEIYNLSDDIGDWEFSLKLVTRLLDPIIDCDYLSDDDFDVLDKFLEKLHEVYGVFSHRVTKLIVNQKEIANDKKCAMD